MGSFSAYILMPAIVHMNYQPIPKEKHCPLVVVLAPTRELALQIKDVAKSFAAGSRIRVSCLCGGESKGQQIRELREGVHVS